MSITRKRHYKRDIELDKFGYIMPNTQITSDKNLIPETGYPISCTILSEQYKVGEFPKNKVNLGGTNSKYFVSSTTNGSQILVATSTDLWLSEDEGNEWTSILTNYSSGITFHTTMLPTVWMNDTYFCFMFMIVKNDYLYLVFYKIDKNSKTVESRKEVSIAKSGKTQAKDTYGERTTVFPLKGSISTSGELLIALEQRLYLVRDIYRINLINLSCTYLNKIENGDNGAPADHSSRVSTYINSRTYLLIDSVVENNISGPAIFYISINTFGVASINKIKVPPVPVQRYHLFYNENLILCLCLSSNKILLYLGTINLNNQKPLENISWMCFNQSINDVIGDDTPLQFYKYGASNIYITPDKKFAIIQYPNTALVFNMQNFNFVRKIKSNYINLEIFINLTHLSLAVLFGKIMTF